ncbi:MAG: ATP-binding cassette domain-containing protein [Egibacteraceae bacterium]
MSNIMIEAVGVGKRFGAVTALAGVDLLVPAGSVLGLLGHNGAGKTTLVNILATLTRPSSGSARVAGFDVVRQAHQVRRRIGLTGQFAALDEQISGRDNLVLIARLLGAGSLQARARARELLELFDLTADAKRPVRTYSGGIRRRLDLAASLVGCPAVVFLDEPTTGLDPTSRLRMWQIVQSLVSDGSTVVLTTQYLDEADRLADWIVVLREGRVVASGAPADLKAQVGRRTVTVRFAAAEDVRAAVGALRRAGLRPVPDLPQRSVTVPVTASRDVAAVVRALDGVAVEADELALAEPGLDEVYLVSTRRAGAVTG